MNTPIFVYGTLKQGFNNAPVLARQTFLGQAVIPGKTHRLVNVHGGAYPFPGLIESKSGCPVFGEAYEVTDSCLAYLDRLEGVSHGLYARTKVQVLLVDGRSLEEVTTYVYAGNLRTESCGACWPPKDKDRWRMADKSFVARSSEEDQTYYEISQPGKEPVLTESIDDMCVELAENWTFFGGEKGSYDEWSRAINEVFRSIEDSE